MIGLPALLRRAARRLRSRTAAFLADRRGAVAAFLALGMVPLIGFVGIATDTARAYLVKSRLSSALDAAALAGGRAFYSTNRDADIQMYFAVNFPPNFLGATVAGPTIAIDAADQKVALGAQATVQTLFMHFFGFEHITVAAAAEVTRKLTALDVVLAIDMSGSMTESAGGMSRIQAARDAATTLVDILFGEDETKPFLNVGLVPWGSKVNVMRRGVAYDPVATTTQAVAGFVNPITGGLQTQVFFANNSPVPLLSAPHFNWRGCVFNRYLHDGNAGNDADIRRDAIILPLGEWAAWQPIGPEGEPVAGSARCAMAVGNNECTPCPAQGISALQNARQPILDGINALTNPNGNTNIPAGLGWAWRVLKPGEPFAEAIPNPPYERQQAIVLLTDGENFAGSGDGYKTVFGYGSAGRPGMDARLRLLAANIKADGVIIYVIQFANNGTALQALLKEVASGPDTPYYHYAPDAATLQQVFREVANDLSELRLSK